MTIVDDESRHMPAPSIGGATTAPASGYAPIVPLRDRARTHAGSADLLLFRVGRELFAADLSAVEEAVELAEVRRLPEMVESMLGVFTLRGRLLPVYSPTRPLGVALEGEATAALIVKAGERRIALAVDDVDDVLTIDLAALRPVPGGDDPDGILLGVARRGRDLVAVLDADALVAACLTDRVPETA
jgi:purine-binding chemotaxis protein CheW